MPSQKKQKRSVIQIVLILFLCAAVAFSVLSAFAYYYPIVSTKDDIRTISQVEEEGLRADTIVVLGASVYADGTPSDILADRLEVAADLYLAGAAPSIIVSGDGREEHYNEPDAMKAYCVQLGVPEDVIQTDPEGYDTFASMYRAHYIYGADSAFVVTQAYHLYRALSIADGIGMPSLGVAADKGNYDNQTMYSLREILARDKDLINTLLASPPRT